VGSAAQSSGPRPLPALGTPALAPSAIGGVRQVPPPLPSAPFAYPRESQPLTARIVPGTTMAEDDPVDATSGIHAVWGPRRFIVNPPDPLVFDLQVLDNAGHRLPATDAVVRIRGQSSSPETGPWYVEAFKEIDDGVYVATHTPPPAEEQLLLKGGQHLVVEVKFEAPNNLGSRTYGTTMMYSRPARASLTGTFSDSIVNGSLVIQVGINASVAGSFRLIGSLFGPDGQTAIASGTQSVTLAQGPGTIPLMFFGKILDDKGTNGPYVLQDMMIFEKETEVDEDPGPLETTTYTTRAYSWRDFSPNAYTQPPPDFEAVDMNSPSQQGKPPPLYDQSQRNAPGSVNPAWKPPTVPPGYVPNGK
jgi:hypothetical protein